MLIFDHSNLLDEPKFINMFHMIHVEEKTGSM